MTTSFEHAVYAQSVVLLLIYVKLPYDCKEFYTFIMLRRLLEHIRGYEITPLMATITQNFQLSDFTNE